MTKFMSTGAALLAAGAAMLGISLRDRRDRDPVREGARSSGRKGRIRMSSPCSLSFNRRAATIGRLRERRRNLRRRAGPKRVMPSRSS